MIFIAKTLISNFNLGENADPQKYGLGFKELWEIDPSKHSEGTVMHTLGWPLQNNQDGGSFIYHIENNQVYVGYVVALGYKNPYLSPFDEFQKFKTHTSIAPLALTRETQRAASGRIRHQRLYAFAMVS